MTSAASGAGNEGVVPRDRRGPFLTPYRRAMVTMIEDERLTPLDRLVLTWLLFAVEPGTRRLDGVTITSIAEALHVGRPQMRASLKRLAGFGFIRYRFERRTTGWVELAVYDRMVAWTEWLADQRKKALVNRSRSDRQVAVDGPNRTNSPAETLESFLILSTATTEAGNGQHPASHKEAQR